MEERASLADLRGVNEATYGHVIDQLMPRIFGNDVSSSSPVQVARRRYLREAIAKGASLTPDPMLKTLDETELDKAAGDLPDKQATGSRGEPVSLDAETRAGFADAAARRKDDARRDKLFPKGEDDFFLPFIQTEASLSARFRQFLSAHNRDAKAAYEAAQAEDRRRMAEDPKARPRAGKTLDQRALKLDPDDPSRLMSYNRNKKQWERGQKLNRFLQSIYEWGLYDDVQIGLDTSELNAAGSNGADGDRASRQDTSFSALANHHLVDGDPFLQQGKLRILVSRDPQKVGEMSTGQRWRSCMAVDGVNARFVPEDIEHGTLVAYVVHEDDPKGRYPLMRCLLKPFSSALTGQEALVPAKIYGGTGEGNSATRAGFMNALQSYCIELTRGQSGRFEMNPRLYADGQATTISVSEAGMGLDETQRSIQQFLEGALTEVQAELKQAVLLAEEGRNDAFGHAPERGIREQTRLLANLYSPDENAGLPRIFYRVMRKTYGVPPSPRTIVAALQADKTFQQRAKDFAALTKGTPEQAQEVVDSLLAGGSSNELNRLAIAAAILTPEDSPRAEAVERCLQGCCRFYHYNPGRESNFFVSVLEQSPRGSLARKVAIKRVIDGLEEIKSAPVHHARRIADLAREVIPYCEPDAPAAIQAGTEVQRYLLGKDPDEWGGNDIHAFYHTARSRPLRQEVIRAFGNFSKHIGRFDPVVNLLIGAMRPPDQTDDERIADLNQLIAAQPDESERWRIVTTVVTAGADGKHSPTLTSRFLTAAIDIVATFSDRDENGENNGGRRRLALLDVLEAYARTRDVPPLTDVQQEKINDCLESFSDKDIRRDIVGRMANLEGPLRANVPRNAQICRFFRDFAVDEFARIENPLTRANAMNDLLEYSGASAAENEKIGRLALKSLCAIGNWRESSTPRYRFFAALGRRLLPDNSTLLADARKALQAPLPDRIRNAWWNCAESTVNAVATGWNSLVRRTEPQSTDPVRLDRPRMTTPMRPVPALNQRSL